MTVRECYASTGHLVMASIERLPIGQFKRNDWNEDDMAEYRWAVVGPATAEDLHAQNATLGFTNDIDRRFRYFYRVVALD